MSKNTYREAVRFVLLLVFCARLILLLGIIMTPVLWLLWNWILPDILHMPAITFMQAFGLGLLFDTVIFVPLAVIVIAIKASTTSVSDEIMFLAKELKQRK